MQLLTQVLNLPKMLGGSQDDLFELLRGDLPVGCVFCFEGSLGLGEEVKEGIGLGHLGGGPLLLLEDLLPVALDVRRGRLWVFEDLLTVPDFGGGAVPS